MKLKIYDKSNTTSAGSPKLTVRTSGAFALNKHLVVAMGLKVGDTIAFVQDEDAPKDWFIQINPPKDGFVLNQSKHDGLTFGCSALSKTLLASLKLDHTTAMSVASEPILLNSDPYWAIITASAK